MPLDDGYNRYQRGLNLQNTPKERVLIPTDAFNRDTVGGYDLSAFTDTAKSDNTNVDLSPITGRERPSLGEEMGEILNRPGRTFEDGMAKFSNNPIAGTVDMVTGAIESGLLPISVGFALLDRGLRELGSDPLADLISAPFVMASEGVVEGQKLIDKGLDVAGIKELTKDVMSKEQGDELAESMTRLNQLGAQLLAGKAIHSGTKSLKTKLGGEKVNPIETRSDIKPYNALDHAKGQLKEQLDIQKKIGKSKQQILPEAKLELNPELPKSNKTGGVRVEKSKEWLEERYDVGKETVNEIFDARQSKEYKRMRDDGTQTYADALEQSKLYKGITEETLLSNKIPDGYVFNKAQQIRVDQIATKKAQKIVELKESFNKNLELGEKNKLNLEQAKTLEQEILGLKRLQAIYKNNGREAARVLEAMRKRNKMTPEQLDLIQEVSDRLGGSKDLKEMINNVNKATDPTFKDKAFFWWYNSVLSNPLTDLANITGNATNLIWETTTQLPMSPVQTSVGFMKGLKSGVKNAKRVWDGEQRSISKFTEMDSNLKEILPTKTLAMTRTKNTLLPTSRLAIEDAFFRSIFESIREQQSAKKLGKEFGVKTKDVLNTIDGVLNKGKDYQNAIVEKVGTERLLKEIDAIENYATKQVFQKPLGGAGRKFQRFLNDPLASPIKLFAMPFLRIAVNLTKVSAESSPFGTLKALGFSRKSILKFRDSYKDLTKLEKQDIWRRATAGTLVYGLLGKLVSDGKIEITGDGPANPATRELWKTAGYEENRIVINNDDGTKTLIPYLNVSPFNILLGTFGTISDKAKWDNPKDEDTPIDALILRAALGVTSALGNQSFLQGTSTLITALERENEKAIQSALARMVTPNAIGFYKEFIKGDDIIYEADTIGEMLQRRVGAGNLDKKTDSFGEPLKSTYRRFPFPKDMKQNEVAQWLLDNDLGVGEARIPKGEDGHDLLNKKDGRAYQTEYKQMVAQKIQDNFDKFLSSSDAANERRIRTYKDRVRKKLKRIYKPLFEE